MREWTEQEEQEMIERAKAGEPEANYELSLWALARSEEEPDEPRWNRLAAKCLVKAANAGYAPAQKQMAGLLDGSGAADQSRPAESQRRSVRQPSGSQEPVSIHDVRRAAADKNVSRQTATPRPTAPRQTTTARRPVPRQPEEGFVDEPDGGYEEETPVARRAPNTRRDAPDRRPAPRRRAPEPEPDYYDGDEDYDNDESYGEDDRDRDGWDDEPAKGKGRPARDRKAKGKSKGREKKGSSVSNWGDAQWRRLELICVIICVVLLIAIAAMIFTSRRGGGGDTPSAIPPAGEAAPALPTDTPAPVEAYPDEATRTAIEQAELDIPPMEEDFRDGPTTATVSVNSISLRLRKGPNTSYDEITSMPDGSKVEVFADKNDWSLVRYQAEDGPIYGWCSSTYLIIDATPASIG